MNVKVLAVAVVALLSSVDCVGQNEGIFSKMFNNDMGENYTSHLSLHNTAVLAFRQGGSVSLLFRNGFLSKELMDKSMLFRLCHNRNLVTAQLDHFGFSKMGDLVASCGYGRLFGSRFAAALRFVYLYSYAQGYHSLHSFTVDMSLAASLTERLLLTVSAYNPVRMKYGVVGQQYIPVEVNVNMAYALSGKVLLACSLQKSFPGQYQLSMLCVTSLSKHLGLSLTCGVPQPFLSLSCFVRWQRFSLEVASAYHFPLGLSPQCRLTYGF